MIFAAFLSVGVFLVACGAALGWYLRGDDVDDAYWSGYRQGLDALGTLHGTR